MQSATLTLRNPLINMVAAGAIALCFFSFYMPRAQAASLTEPQIQAILNLLHSFGADQPTIANTEAALRGTSTPPTPPTPSSSAGALSVSIDAASPQYQIVAAGRTGVTLGAFRFSAAGEDIHLQQVGLYLASGSTPHAYPGDLTRVQLYDGSTLVGTGIFAGDSYGTSILLTSPVTIAKGSYKVLTVKGDLASIGTGQPGHPGSLVQVGVITCVPEGCKDGASYGVGLSSGVRVNSVGSVASSAGVRIFRSYPTVLPMPLPDSGLSDGRLMRFAIAAGQSGSISLAKLNFRLAQSGVTTSGHQLFVYADSLYSTPVPVPGNTAGLNGTGSVAYNETAGVRVEITFSDGPLQIPAGQIRYFELRTSSTLTGASGSVSTTLLGDTVSRNGAYPYVAGGPNQLFIDNMVWSPNDFSVSSLNDADWTNGYGVEGLPASGISQTRTGSATSLTPAINSFTATPSYLAGQSSTLSWNASNVQDGGCYIFEGNSGSTITPSDNWGSSGTFTVVPSVTTIYKLWCTSSWKDGSPTAEKTVTVTVSSDVRGDFDSYLTSGPLTSATPTISGTVQGLSAVRVTLSSLGKTYYDSGSVPVSNGKWTTTITIPIANGSYALGLWDASRATHVVNTSITIQVSAAAASVSANAATYIVGSPVTVSWSNMSSPTSKDWVALVLNGAQWSQAIAPGENRGWFWTNGAASGQKTLVAPSLPGLYQLVYYKSATGAVKDSVEVARSTSFAVANPAPVAGSAAVSTDASSYSQGANITVHWSGVSGGKAKDWVALVLNGAQWSQSVGAGENRGWFWTNGAASGQKTLVAPVPGTYQVVYYVSATGALNDSVEVARSASFEVPSSTSASSFNPAGMLAAAVTAPFNIVVDALTDLFVYVGVGR